MLLARPLAGKFADQDVRNWWCSEKLDGMRAIWTGSVRISREGKPIHAQRTWVEDNVEYVNAPLAALRSASASSKVGSSAFPIFACSPRSFYYGGLTKWKGSKLLFLDTQARFILRQTGTDPNTICQDGRSQLQPL
jgi:hypothetical protein